MSEQILLPFPVMRANHYRALLRIESSKSPLIGICADTPEQAIADAIAYLPTMQNMLKEPTSITGLQQLVMLDGKEHFEHIDLAQYLN